MKKMFLTIVLFALGVIVLPPEIYAAEKFPTKEITLICPWAAGGGTDTVARALVKNAKKHFGVTVNVVNQTGGGGIVGQTAIAQARPDGYTAGILAFDNHYPFLQGKAQYGFFNHGLDPLCVVNFASTALSVRADDNRFKDFKEFLAKAKEKPKTLTVGISGVGDSYHLNVESLAIKYGYEFIYVPFGGAANSRIAMIGGHVDSVSNSIDEMLPFYKSKQARILIYFADKRHPLFPDVPTSAELGFPVVGGVYRLIGLPDNVPAERKAILLKGFKECFNDPEFKSLLEQLALIPVWMEGEPLNKYMKDYISEINVVLKRIGLVK